MVVGLDTDGQLAAEAVLVTQTSTPTTAAWSMYLGAALGHIDTGVAVTVSGTCWAATSWEEATAHVSDLPDWTISGPAGDPEAWDGRPDDTTVTDVVDTPLAITGAWSVTENSTIVFAELTGGVWVVVTELLTETYVTGDYLLREE